ncbi:hypothetical protein ACW0US_18140 [Xanthomonas euvesicatoria]
MSVHVKVLQDGKMLAEGTMHTVFGGESLLRLGREIEYTSSASMQIDPSAISEPWKTQKATVFDGIEIKVTPTEASDHSGRNVLLLSEAHFMNVRHLRDSTVAGATIQLPEVDDFHTKQTARVQLGGTQVLGVHTGKAFFAVEITPNRQPEAAP